MEGVGGGEVAKQRGTKAEAHVKQRKKIINWHNFTFSLAARGSEERRTIARGLEFFATLN